MNSKKEVWYIIFIAILAIIGALAIGTLAIAVFNAVYRTMSPQAVYCISILAVVAAIAIGWMIGTTITSHLAVRRRQKARMERNKTKILVHLVDEGTKKTYTYSADGRKEATALAADLASKYSGARSRIEIRCD